ncbi:MAG: hypothetical protein RJB22_24 [Pseudomonadota bacterium]
MIKPVFFARLGLVPLLLGTAAALPAQQVSPMSDASMIAVEDDPAAQLSANLKALARDPYNVDALIQAGTGALAIGDTNAAFGFFARAEELSPRNWRAKAGLASSLTQMEKSADALRFFDEAAALGAPEADIAADRGLAYDLAGDPKRAQKDYLTALRLLPSDEATRRLALSLGISGDRDGALSRLDPLVRRNDQGAWRARAFVLAMNGDVAGAERIVRMVAPANTAAYMVNFLQKLSALGPSARAHAVHFGTLPASGQTPQVAVEEGGFRPLDQVEATRLAAADLDRKPSTPATSTDPRQARRSAKQDRELALLAARGKTANAPAQPAAASPARVMVVPVTPPAARVEPILAAAPPPPPAATPAAPVATPTTTAASSAPVVVQPSAVSTPAPSAQAQLASAPQAPPTALFEVPALPSKSAAGATPAGPPPAAAATARTAAAPTMVASAPPPPTSPAPVVPQAATPVASAPLMTATAPPAPAPVSAAAPASTASSGQWAVRPAAPAASTVPTGTTAPSPASQVRVAALPPSSAPQMQLPSLGSPQMINPAPNTAAPAQPSSMSASRAPAFTTGTPPASPAPQVAQVSPAVRAAAAPITATSTPVPVRTAPPPVVTTAPMSLADVVRTLALEEETTPVALPDAAKMKALRLAAQKKAAAEEKARAEKAEKERLAAEEAAQKRRHPARIWVQIASGPNSAGLPGTWRSIRDKAPEVLDGKKAWSVPYLRTNRLLVGPVRSSSAARDLVNDLAKEGVAATIFSSEAGQEIERVGG